MRREFDKYDGDAVESTALANANHDMVSGHFSDKYFLPVTDNSVCDAINTLISFFWFMLVLAPYFFVVDTIRPGGLSPTCKKQK